jgi:Glycosyl transferase family 2
MVEMDDVKNAMIDVLVRYHDPSRQFELSRCAMSLVAQSWRNVNIVICAQRFSDQDVQKTASLLEWATGLSESVTFKILNFQEKEPLDARSSLLNMGIKHTEGRFLALLDYDDVIYPNAYSMLIEELLNSDTALAFASVYVKHVNAGDTFAVQKSKTTPFRGKGLIDLFASNFCPIHSFVIDRHKITSDQLFLEPSLTRGEDYDLLLRLTSMYPASFEKLNRFVGDYYYKDDGSNTILVESTHNAANYKSWVNAEEFLELRRRTLMVSNAVMLRLGLGHIESRMSIRDLLEQKSKLMAVLAEGPPETV